MMSKDKLSTELRITGGTSIRTVSDSDPRLSTAYIYGFTRGRRLILRENIAAVSWNVSPKVSPQHHPFIPSQTSASSFLTASSEEAGFEASRRGDFVARVVGIVLILRAVDVKTAVAILGGIISVVLTAKAAEDGKRDADEGKDDDGDNENLDGPEAGLTVDRVRVTNHSSFFYVFFFSSYVHVTFTHHVLRSRATFTRDVGRHYNERTI